MEAGLLRSGYLKDSEAPVSEIPVSLKRIDYTLLPRNIDRQFRGIRLSECLGVPQERSLQSCFHLAAELFSFNLPFSFAFSSSGKYSLSPIWHPYSSIRFSVMEAIN